MDKKLLKQYKSTFHFGASVRYEKMLTREYGKDEFGDGTEFGTRVIKEWKQTQVSTRTGIVVGWRWLSNGIGNYDSENGYYYTITESVFAIEVKRGMMNQVDLVLPESLTATKAMEINSRLPDRIPIWSEFDKNRLRNEMKHT